MKIVLIIIFFKLLKNIPFISDANMVISLHLEITFGEIFILIFIFVFPIKSAKKE